MENAIHAPWPDSEVSLPGDLGDWIDKHTLARLVLAAVQAASLPSASAGPDRSDSFRPHMVLSLLTYCYASGIYPSADIELSSTQDTMVRHLCADHYPEAHLLRSFRRYHRPSIRKSLAEVLQRAWQIHAGIEESDPDAAVHTSSSTLHPRTASGDVLQFVAAAEERIDCAVRLDCWASDY